ncbi:MAG: bifunctional aconitate hydratase 2/2-methylisocitrate dehydratase, partial [Alphaproteobacteria bacterium]
MSLFDDYLAEIEERKKQDLKPKPIDDGALTAELIGHITDAASPHRAACLDFLVYNTLPGTTSAAGVKAKFLKDIISGNIEVAEISAQSAFEQLSHMKGGPSIEVLLDLALDGQGDIAATAADVLKSQVFLYEADTARLADAHKKGHKLASDILKSYAAAEFFTKLTDIKKKNKLVNYYDSEG